MTVNIGRSSSDSDHDTTLARVAVTMIQHWPEWWPRYHDISPEHTLPQLETDNQVLELCVAQPPQTGLLLVHCYHHLSAHLDTGAGLDVVWNKNNTLQLCFEGKCLLIIVVQELDIWVRLMIYYPRSVLNVQNNCDSVFCEYFHNIRWYLSSFSSSLIFNIHSW